MPSSETDAGLAARLATAAGELLVARRAQMFRAEAPYWAVMDDGDAVAQAYLAAELATHRPDDAVLSEEGADDPRRFGGGRVWIIDPLDGTREYAEPARPDWAVHVALWDADHFVAGAVALPDSGITLSTDPAPEVPMVKRARPVVVTSRSRTSWVSGLVAAAIGAEILPMGSAGAKAMAVVTGAADVYAHAGGMYQWQLR